VSIKTTTLSLWKMTIWIWDILSLGPYRAELMPHLRVSSPAPGGAPAIIRAILLIESLPAVWEMEEMLYALVGSEGVLLKERGCRVMRQRV